MTPYGSVTLNVTAFSSMKIPIFYTCNAVLSELTLRWMWNVSLALYENSSQSYIYKDVCVYMYFEVPYLYKSAR